MKMKLVYAFMLMLSVVTIAGNAFAVDATPAEVLAAVDITGLSAAVLPILTGLVGIGLLFVGFKYAKRVMNRA